MDDNFTTGPKDEDKLWSVKAATDDLTALVREVRDRLDKRLRDMQVDLREMVLERRKQSSTLAAMNRAIQRRTPDGPSLTDRLREDAATWDMYANLQRLMDRLDQRLEEIEKKLEPPLPPFSEFKPKP